MATATEEMQREAVAIAKWWRKNAEIRHGHIPYPEEIPQITSKPRALLRGILPLLAVLATAALVYLYFQSPRHQQSTEQAELPAESLLQYLEDEGMNVPE